MAAKAAILSVGLLATGVLEVTNARPANTTQPASVRFAAVHVCVDSKDQALAAYQCEISAKNADVKIVGIEGNRAVAAFAEPPYYDPKALLDKRLILAAFSTSKALPSGSTRVATIHVQITGDAEPEYAIKLTAAAAASGARIQADATLNQGEQL